LVHRRVEELAAVAAQLLGPIERRVRVLHQRLGIRRVVGIEAGPDARGHEMLSATQEKRPPHAIEELPGDRGRVRSRLHPLDEDRQLVSAEPCQAVRLPEGVLQPRRDRLKKLIPDGVSQGVVDQLEAVEVEDEHGRLPLIAPRLGQGEPQVVEQQVPVRKPGERVVERAMLGERGAQSGRLPLPRLGLEALLVGEGDSAHDHEHGERTDLLGGLRKGIEHLEAAQGCE
jgi:hypothetical protein